MPAWGSHVAGWLEVYALGFCNLVIPVAVLFGFGIIYHSLSMNHFETKYKITVFLIHLIFLMISLWGTFFALLKDVKPKYEHRSYISIALVSGLLSLLPWVFKATNILASYREKQGLFVEHFTYGAIILSIMIISFASILSRFFL